MESDTDPRFSYERHPVEDIEPLDEEYHEYDDQDLARLGAFEPELLATLLRVLIFPERRQVIRTAHLRVIALAHALHVEPIGSQSLTELAAQLGCTKQLLSHYVTPLRDFGSLDHHAGRSGTAREIYAKAQHIQWNQRNRTNKEARSFKETVGYDPRPAAAVLRSDASTGLLGGLAGQPEG